MRTKQFLVVIIVLGLFLMYIYHRHSYFYYYLFNNHDNNSQRGSNFWWSYKEGKFPSNTKIILIWTPYFGSFNLWQNVFDRIAKNNCGETRCLFTKDKQLLPRADAVVFHHNELHNLKLKEVKRLNQHRKAFQIFVYFNMEPPNDHSKILLSKFKNFFNWSMTYRRDSDVQVPYGEIYALTQLRKPSDVYYITQKELDEKKMAIWLSSHCKTSSKRETLVKELKKNISVDIFGKCSNRKCGQRAVIGKASDRDLEDEDCYQKLHKYAFYLAFENTLCTDYVTEKLYRTLKIGLVPVVYGGADYSYYAPPDSVIDAAKFESVTQLALYLEKVKNNATLYNSYLDWKNNYDIELGSPYKPLVCDLCLHLYSGSENRTSKTYRDINEWALNTKCLKYTDFFV